jgi:hypothetical protein
MHSLVGTSRSRRRAHLTRAPASADTGTTAEVPMVCTTLRWSKRIRTLGPPGPRRPSRSVFSMRERDRVCMEDRALAG